MFPTPPHLTHLTSLSHPASRFTFHAPRFTPHLFLTPRAIFVTLTPQDRMSKLQFWTLNIAGGICALLIIWNVALGQVDLRLNKSVLMMQNQFNQAQRLQNTAQNLLGRVAQDGQKDATLRDLLAKHGFKFTPNTNTPVARTP